MKKHIFQKIAKPFSLALGLLLGVQFILGQKQNVDNQELTPNQIIEREMTGAESHSYKFDLKENEFFQVRVEQKGVDVTLELLDATNNVLAKMDSPNGIEGPETLSFIAEKPGSFILKVNKLEAQAAKGKYTIERKASRTATLTDERRVEVENLFVKGIDASDRKEQLETAIIKLEAAREGWQELKDDYLLTLTTELLIKLRQLQNLSDVSPLPVGETIERKIEGGRVHGYYFKLKQGQVLQIEIQEKNVDVLINLGRAQNLETVAKVDLNSGNGREMLTYTAESSGSYALVIGAINERAENYFLRNIYNTDEAPRAGSYQLKTEIRDVTTIKDHQRVEAQKMLLEGLETLDGKSPESPGEAIKKFEAGLKLWQKLEEKYWEAYTLNLIGFAQIKSNKLTDAFETIQQAILAWKSAKDKNGEAVAIEKLAEIYFGNGKKLKSIETLHFALDLVRETGNRWDEAKYLAYLYFIYKDIGDRAKSGAYIAAADARNSSDDFGNMARLLSELGGTQKVAGDIQAAKELLELALIYARLDDNKFQQALLLRSLAEIYLKIELLPEALKRADLSLQLSREINDQLHVAFALGYLSEISIAMDEPQKAMGYINQALSIVGTKKYIKISLWAGEAYNAANDPKKAMPYLKEALVLAKRSIDQTDEAKALKGLMTAWRALGNSRLAIFYGKQATNILQQQRTFFQAVDQREDDSPNVTKNAQRMFLKLYDSVYKQLAELLIEEKRLTEAQEVLMALKDQRALDFDASDEKEKIPFFRAPYKILSATSHETLSSERFTKFDERFRSIKSKLHRWSEESEEDSVSIKIIPKKRRELSEEEELKEDEVTIRELDTAAKDFAEVVNAVESNFSKPVSAIDAPPDVFIVTELQTILRQIAGKMNQPSVAVYQLISKEKFYSLIVTADNITSVSVSIKGKELNSKALQFWALLQSDDFNPTLLSNELYKIIFTPIEGKLPKDVKTILWSLDSNLRYIPMAALYDGKQYLVERYQHVLFNRADKERLMRNVSPKWTGYGFAVSSSHKVEYLENSIEFKSLDYVKDEMQIFQTKTYPKGLIAGEVFPESEFTKKSFITTLKQRRPLVHISSHFRFRPGNDSSSFLLLGDGSIMSLAEMREQKDLFQGVELLTLSACDTAAQLPNANGREIDTFAELAQRLGADAVMASLWAVMDSSTAQLMKSFYKNREDGKYTKAEALQKAQLDLLYEKTQIPTITDKVNKKSPETDPVDINLVIEKKYLVYLKPDEKKTFAHPYYWSPFVLFGNWQ